MKQRHRQIHSNRRDVRPVDVNTQKKRILSLVQSAKRSSSPTNLSIGDVVKIQGVEHVVWMVNDSRAACVPISGQLTIVNPYDSVNISPNSKLPIVRQLGKEGLVALLAADNKQTTGTTNNHEEKETMDKKKEKAGNGGSKYGTIEGQPVPKAIRTMKKLGWSNAEIQATLKELKLNVPEKVVKWMSPASEKKPGCTIPKAKLEALRVRVEEPKADEAKKGKDKSPKSAKKATAAKPATKKEEKSAKSPSKKKEDKEDEGTTAGDEEVEFDDA